VEEEWPAIHNARPLGRIFKKMRLAEQIFRLKSGLAEVLQKRQNLAENRAANSTIGGS